MALTELEERLLRDVRLNNEKFQNELRAMKEQFNSLQAHVEARETRLSFRIESLTKQLSELSTLLKSSTKANADSISVCRKLVDELGNMLQK